MNDVLIYDVVCAEGILSELKKIVADIFDRTNTVVSNKTVLVKPNMLGAFESSRGATTDPILIKAIVEVLEERDAKNIFVGDSPGGVEKGTEGTAKKCGIYDASKGYFYNFGKDVVLSPIKSRFVKNINIVGIIKKVDIVINVPKLKSHGYMGFSACIKNMFGIVVGPYKANMHFRAPSVAQFAELLVDIYEIRKPDLNIIDAIVVMEGDGPTSGPLRTENMIIAGTDGIAVDTVVSKMLTFESEQIKYLTVAKKRSLGETTFENINIVGKFRVIEDFIKPVTYMPVKETGDMISSKRQARGINSSGLTVLYEIGKMVPNLTRPENCSRCGICVNSCPVKAIEIDDLPVIDYKKCISCYCCSELCHNNCYDILDTKDKMDDIFTQFLK